MRKIKILHAADLHLDSPFEGLPEGKAAQRRQEQRELLGKIAEIVQTQEIQLVLLSGDLLDSDSAYAETGEELLSALRTMSVPVFIAPGNHDCYTAGSPYAKLDFPGNVHIFRRNEMECVELPELGVRVWGAAFTDKYSAGLLEGFCAEKAEDTLDVMCIHGDVNPASRYNPITEEQIAASNMNYIALGHTHLESGLRKSGKTYYAWPGCPEGRGFDETGDKHIYIVGIVDDETRIMPVSVAGRRYEILPVELEGREPMTAIDEVINDDTSRDIYRIILRGETEEAPDISNLRIALESRFYSLQLRDETHLVKDIWEKAGEDSLRGIFLAKLKEAYNKAYNETEREKIMQAVRWGLAALDKREEVIRHDD